MGTGVSVDRNSSRPELRSVNLSATSRVSVGPGATSTNVLCIMKTYGPDTKVALRKVAAVPLQSLQDTIGEVRKRLRGLLGVEDVDLLCRGVPTDDKKPVDFYQVQELFDCFVAYGFKPTYELVVAMPTGEVHTVQVQKRGNIGQLLRKVCDMGGISEAMSETFEFEHRGRMLKRWHILEMYGVHEEPRLTLRPKNWFIDITINTFSADTYPLPGLAPTATIAIIKQIVADEWNIQTVQQKLTFRNRTLEDQLTLADYQVHSGAALHLLQLTAADVPANNDMMFVDPMALDGSLTKQEGLNWLDPQTSKWRGARRGFCIEARCNNPNCEANGCAVICSSGLGSFELNEEWSKATCPACKSKANPIACAFNRCKWMYKGVRGQQGGGAGAEITDQHDWAFVGDKFEHARELTRTPWRKLLIVARPTGHDHDVLMRDVGTFPGSPNHSMSDSSTSQSTNSIECLLCYETLHMEDRAMGAYCKHPFHQGCWSVWVMAGGACPTCRVPIKRSS